VIKEEKMPDGKVKVIVKDAKTGRIVQRIRKPRDAGQKED